MESDDSLKPDIVLVWQDMVPQKWGESLIAFVLSVLDRLNIEECSMSLVFSSDTFIRELNKTYRNKDYATDVLSFPSGNVEAPLSEPTTCIEGDLVISPFAVMRNAETFSVPPWEEMERVIVHGILHLAGMDHKTNEPVEDMLVLQEKILSCVREEFEFEIR
ncbi:rRNA maturation RNase YbeY [Spirochaetia bacterium 38H-sp]|uniref:Endoribonuclease YbeY n=1 Tax=Rarispira pelagica TaxID=3141764 RepID=A0ABU9UD01_9SPIR